eukprot:129973_1
MAATTLLFIICVSNSAITPDPTNSPSVAPSYSPTAAPTRVPTAADQYDAYIAIEYEVTGLTEADQSKIETDTVSQIGHIQELIEMAYFQDYYTEYRMFWVNIQQINGKNIDDFSSNDWDSDAMILSARIETDTVARAGVLILKSQSLTFKENVAQRLQIYFVNQGLVFNVLEAEDLEVVERSPAASCSMWISSCITIFFVTMLS